MYEMWDKVSVIVWIFVPYALQVVTNFLKERVATIFGAEVFQPR
jgi:hypothetical protein